jgi:hypothetical protein
VNQKEYPGPSIPSMQGAPDQVTAPRESRRVETRWAGISYTKFMVDGWDVDHGSIEAVES